MLVQESCLSKLYGGVSACICIQENIHLRSFEAYYSKIILFRTARDIKVEYYFFFLYKFKVFISDYMKNHSQNCKVEI